MSVENPNVIGGAELSSGSLLSGGLTSNYRIPDVILLPVPDYSSISTSKKIIGSVGSLFLSIVLNSVLQLEVDKGNVITARRVDGGYALTQRGSKNDDRVYIRVLVTGTLRYLTTQILSYYSDNKTTPITFLSRPIRLARTQIESLKIVVNSERRQAIMIDISFRQLRSFQSDVVANVLNAGVATLLPYVLNDANIYSSVRATTRSGNAVAVNLQELLI